MAVNISYSKSNKVLIKRRGKIYSLELVDRDIQANSRINSH